MPEKPNTSFESLLLHGGGFSDVLNSCAVPIYTSAAFGFNSSEHGVKLLSLSELGSIYSRFTNPTVNVFQNRVAQLEGGIAACAVASGSAAVTMTVLALAGKDDNIVSSNNVHAGTLHMFKALAEQMGIECRFIIGDDLEEYRSAIDKRTKFIFIESISNPQYAIPDMEGLARLAHENGVPLVCDNTFGCAGYFCRPIDFGVDIVVHSATKWIGGHGTTIGGVVVDAGNFDWGRHRDRFPQFHDSKTRLWEKFGRRAFAVRCQWEILRDIGCTLGATAAQQLLVGLESLAVRCERHASNARQMAVWLAEQPQIAWVNYLGSSNHPYHERAKKYLQRGFGGMLSFAVRGGQSASFRLCNALRMVTITTNLGDSKTLVVHPWSTTHEPFDDTERKLLGVTDDLIRLSVGIEHIEDIKADFRQALEQLSSQPSVQLRDEGHVGIQRRLNCDLYGDGPMRSKL